MEHGGCKLKVPYIAYLFADSPGLGYEGAKHLARNGVSHLILACRNTGRGEAAAERLKEELPDWKGEVRVWELDMSRFDSVKQFGERLSTLDRLDILILSAGVSPAFLPSIFSQFTSLDDLCTRYSIGRSNFVQKDFRRMGRGSPNQRPFDWAARIACVAETLRYCQSFRQRIQASFGDSSV